MTCLIDRALSGAGMKLHTSMLGGLFGTMYANFQVKIFAEISGRKFQTFHCSNFLKIGIHSAKAYTKKAPNIEVCNFIPAPLRDLSIKQDIVALYK